MAYTKMLMLTPGKRRASVSVIDQRYPVRGFSRKPAIIPLLDESGVTFTSECIKERIDHKRDCPVLVTGDRGIGKSTAIQKVARKINPDLTVDHIAFKLEEFEQIFDKNPHGDGEKGIYPQVILDEAGHALFGPEWLTREQRVIAKQLIISRIKRQVIWMAVPKRMQFNNQLRNMASIWIHVSEPQEFVQGYAVVRMAPAHLQSEFHADRFWEAKYAFIFSEETGPFWEEYEKKKIAFVNEVTRDTANKKDTRQEEKIAAAIKRAQELGYTQPMIGKIFDVTQPRISQIVNKNSVES